MVRFLGLAAATLGPLALAAACSGSARDAPPSGSNDAAQRDPPDAVTQSKDGGDHEDGEIAVDRDAGSDALDRNDGNSNDGDTGAADTNSDLDAGSGAADGGPIVPAIAPVYRIELQIHVGQSGLAREELAAVLDEMTFIWWSQAAICFEIRTSRDDAPSTSGFDLWFVPELAEYPDSNGVINSDHEIYVRDYPILGPARSSVRHPAARTASHELGHGLGLQHYNGRADSPESLMASRQSGYLLHDFEIAVAREQAMIKGLRDTTPVTCSGPQIE